MMRGAVDRLLDSRPELRARLGAFLDSQKQEYELLDRRTREAIWLVRRA